ncbi:MAG: pantoate--beta-alanine ligase, partial [Streptomycetales bacterium]
MGEPIVAADRATLAKELDRISAAGRRVVLVPTMGALHEGHRALFRRAGERGGVVVASIFVNPLQFGPAEDLTRYPRSWDADREICRAEGVGLVFAPTLDVIYPVPQTIRVSAGDVGSVLEGASRPGHFEGVLTVVLKLFELVRPAVAVFGEKDAQQLALVRRMVRELCVPVAIEPVPTVREPGGLAVSSRNRYLSPAERRTAGALS